MLDDPVQRILSALEAHGCNPRQAGETQWQARCPSHEDRRPSLSVGIGRQGQVLLRCHSGCRTAHVVAALGLAPRDLFPDDSGLNRGPKPNGKPKPSTNGKHVGERTFGTAREAIQALEQTLGRKAAFWTYHDAEGRPTGAVVRWNRPDGSKDIRPVSRGPDGRWRIGAMPSPRPLFGLPELLAAPVDQPVVIVEGERCVDAVRACGLLGTTSAGGSSAAGKTDWTPMKNRHVIVLPDNDEPGLLYASSVGRLCREGGAASVRILRLCDYAPSLLKGGDLADILESPDRCGLPIGDATPEAIGRWILATANGIEPESRTDEAVAGPVLMCLADVEPRAVSWLWPGRIPCGRLTLLVGRPGEGKSFLTCDMAARISTGTPWPDGSECPRGSVLLLSSEDGAADTIRPRLDAMRADPRRVHVLAATRRLGEDGRPREVAFTLRDVETLETALRLLPDVRLVVIDPIGSYLGAAIDAHRDNEIRGVLAPVALLAERYGPAVLIVAHRRKSGGASADDLALGSRGFTGIARATWHLTRDTADKARRLFLPGKQNLGPEGSGLAFSIIGDPPRIAWERDPVTLTADDALAEEQATATGQGRSTAFREAVEFLEAALADGPRPVKELLTEWKGFGGDGRRTLDRAKAHLKVVAFRPKVPGPWFWSFPKGGVCGDVVTAVQDCQIQDCQVPIVGNVGNVGNVASKTGFPTLFDGPQVQDCQDCQVPEFGNLETTKPHQQGNATTESQPHDPEPLNHIPPTVSSTTEGDSTPTETASAGGDVDPLEEANRRFQEAAEETGEWTTV